MKGNLPMWTNDDFRPVFIALANYRECLTYQMQQIELTEDVIEVLSDECAAAIEALRRIADSVSN